MTRFCVPVRVPYNYRKMSTRPSDEFRFFHSSAYLQVIPLFLRSRFPNVLCINPIPHMKAYSTLNLPSFQSSAFLPLVSIPFKRESGS